MSIYTLIDGTSQTASGSLNSVTLTGTPDSSAPLLNITAITQGAG